MQIIAGPIIFITLFFQVIFLLCVISIASMVVSLSRQGDERRQMILTQASSQTLYITVALLILTNLEQIIRIFSGNGPSQGMNPFIFLAVISLVYAVCLHHYKKKFGD